jgi:hypothetical protein
MVFCLWIRSTISKEKRNWREALGLVADLCIWLSRCIRGSVLFPSLWNFGAVLYPWWNLLRVIAVVSVVFRHTTLCTP